jgi:hypothetical protein
VERVGPQEDYQAGHSLERAYQHVKRKDEYDKTDKRQGVGSRNSA